MKKKEKKKLREFLSALEDKAELSTKKGVIDKTPQRRPTKKQRRHRGWRTPKLVAKGKYSEIIEEALEPQLYYDDWHDFRDGMRFPREDRTRFIPKKTWLDIDEEARIEINERLKKLEAIKEARRDGKKRHK